MNRPVVSVIMVTYNSGVLSVDCVQSVLASSWPVEVVVSDNGSADGSVEALDELAAVDQRLRVIRNASNLGFAAANNVALRLGDSELVLFLNPDCLVGPATAANMVAALAANPAAGMAGCLIRNPDGSPDPACARPLPTLGRLFRQWAGLEKRPGLASTPEAISGAFMLVRRAVLDHVGAFDAGYFMHWEDLDLCLRVRQAGYGILFVPDVEVLHVRGHSSKRRPYRVEWFKHAGMLRFMHKHYLHGWRAPLMVPLAAAAAMRYLVRASTLRRQPAEEATVVTANDDRPEAWVFGATSLIGRSLLPRLVAAGYSVHAFCSRNAANMPAAPHLVWHDLDLKGADVLPGVRSRLLFHLATLPLLPAWLDQLAAAGGSRVVAFGSTSRYTKRASSDAAERALAAELAAAEAAVSAGCARLGLKWVLLRPTMVYRLGQDANISRLYRLIGLFGFLPLPGRGLGRRQPVHADDLAKACLQLLVCPEAWNRSYDLSGGETLTYRAMVEALFRRLERPARIVSVPVFLWRPMLAMLRLSPAYRHFNVEMARRVDVDMCFNHDDARRMFGFAPRPFEP